MDQKKSKRSSAAPHEQLGSQKRTEMVSVRLTPKLRYATEIAARSQGRTTSSLIEVAVATYLPTVTIAEPADEEDERPMKLMKLMEVLWDPDESDRFVNLAENQRWLLNIDEEHRWKAIREHFKAKGRLTSEQRKTLRPVYEEIKERVAKARREQQIELFGKL